MAGYAEGEDHRGGLRPGQLAVFAIKLAVTSVCFWYLSRNIDLGEFGRAARALDPRWAALAALVMMLQIPLVALRWCKIVDTLNAERGPVARGPLLAITAIGAFFAQVMPNLAADTI